MGINGIAQNYYQNDISSNNYNKNRTGKVYQQKPAEEVYASEGTRQNANVQDIYEAMKTANPLEEPEDDEETDTEIIVKADGSKVMMTTVRVGGMETVMSMEISGPSQSLPANLAGGMDDSNVMVSNTNAVIASTPEK